MMATGANLWRQAILDARMQILNYLSRCFEAAFLVPFYHIVNFFSTNSECLTPFSHAKSNAIYGNHVVVSSVSSLRPSRCPSTIIWGIPSFVILAVYRVFFGWPWPHVGVERFEAFAPTFANGNAATAVIMISFVIGIVAPLVHALPNFEFCRLRETVRSHKISGSFFGKASTTEGASKIGRGDRSKISAIATATPHDIARIGNKSSSYDN